MSLTQEQIEKLSKNLSKIDMQDPKLSEDINNILSYMDLLNEVDTTWVEPTISVVEIENILRDDEIAKDKIATKDLLACSEQKVVANQIAISNIMH